jgi:hypothetical protein
MWLRLLSSLLKKSLSKTVDSFDSMNEEEAASLPTQQVVAEPVTVAAAIEEPEPVEENLVQNRLSTMTRTMWIGESRR